MQHRPRKQGMSCIWTGIIKDTMHLFAWITHIISTETESELACYILSISVAYVTFH